VSSLRSVFVSMRAIVRTIVRSVKPYAQPWSLVP
jgi:hypothetical protein